MSQIIENLVTGEVKRFEFSDEFLDYAEELASENFDNIKFESYDDVDDAIEYINSKCNNLSADTEYMYCFNKNR